MNVEILGVPKTIRLEGNFRGDTYAAPMEVWIMALVSVLSDEQKVRFFSMLRHQVAQVKAAIPMGDIR